LPKVKLPRSPSFRTRKLFRVPDTTTVRLVWQALQTALSEAGYENVRPQWGEGRIYLPDQIYNGLIRHLEKVDLPRDRCAAWSFHGELQSEASALHTLLRVGIDWDRAELISAALMALEAFPSKKPISYVQMRGVLSGVGDVWSEGYRKIHAEDRRVLDAACTAA
jgi:hypothetical protein